MKCAKCKEDIYEGFWGGIAKDEYTKCNKCRKTVHDRCLSYRHGPYKCAKCGREGCELCLDLDSEGIYRLKNPLYNSGFGFFYCKDCTQKRNIIKTFSYHKINGYRIIETIETITATTELCGSEAAKEILINKACLLDADAIVDFKIFPQGRDRLIAKGDAVKIEKIEKFKHSNELKEKNISEGKIVLDEIAKLINKFEEKKGHKPSCLHISKKDENSLMTLRANETGKGLVEEIIRNGVRKALKRIHGIKVNFDSNRTKVE